MTIVSPNTRHNPFPVSAGFESIYAHGVEVPQASRRLLISGQIGLTQDGSLLNGFRAQCEQAIANLMTVLASAHMDKIDLVKLVFLLTRASDLEELGTIRRQLLPVETAVTTLVVVQLARPEFLVEIEGVAAQSGSSR